MELRFRPALASDASVAAPLVYSAGPAAFDYILKVAGRDPLEFLHYAFARGDGYQGHRIHWVAESEGQVLGVGAFYSGSDDLRLSVGMTRQLLAFFPMRAALGAIRRALHTAPLVKPVSRDMLYVANLGVATDARGQGVGQALLRQQMQRAREMGKQRFALDVAVTNPRAQKLYESLGLKFVNEKAFGGDSTRLAVPASRRLELLLT